MSSTANEAASGVDVSAMATPELRLHIERCERLIKNPTLLTRLKDQGAGIRTRFTLFTEELSRRERALKDDSSPASLSTANEQTALEAAQIELRGEVAVQRAIAEKYKDYRVPVEAIARQMYEGSLSEREIQRILADVPPNYFLTSAETQAMQHKAAREARLRELSALRERAADARQPATGRPFSDLPN